MKVFDLLRFFMDHPHQVLSKTRILEHVWNTSFDGEGNLVEVYIHGLRSKIDKGRAPMIRTVRGMGHSLRTSDDRA